MSQKAFWAGAAFVVVIAITGVTLWEVAAPDTDVAGQLAALNTKVDGKLAQIDAKMETATAALAELQKGTPLKSLADKLDALNTGIMKADTALAGITKSIPQNDLGSKIDAIAANLKTVDGGLAAIKQSIPAYDLSTQLAALDTKIKSLNDAVAALQKTGAGAGADKAAAAPNPSDVVVVYLHMPDERQMPKTVATVSPLSVQFAHVGSTEPGAQGKLIIDKIKQIIKDRKDCTISVAGFADTVGSDNINLTISKKRARAVAAQLKTAFAGTGVQINEAAWGERRLKDWTPDKTPSLANRRVDVAVTCKH
jgi:outer membrane protein OmpA-like peptidoglycan-associated protein